MKTFKRWLRSYSERSAARHNARRLSAHGAMPFDRDAARVVAEVHIIAQRASKHTAADRRGLTDSASPIPQSKAIPSAAL
ncbi:hypothetical protein [Psychromicrobium sp. YIM B11713]|uniref:hypothetical protein n=1 Tax=Psychromicrobium sp. YIM B11713 TaxID=3145233 RepID=UPI00374F376B